MIQVSPDNIADRFMRYVKIDTQSDPNSSSHPTSAKQKDLSKILHRELLGMGISNAGTDEFGYVYATIPSNSDKKNIPAIMMPENNAERIKMPAHPSILFSRKYIRKYEPTASNME